MIECRYNIGDQIEINNESYEVYRVFRTSTGAIADFIVLFNNVGRISFVDYNLKPYTPPTLKD